MYTRPENRISIHTTTTGLVFIICPASRFSGCTVDAEGKPTALKYATGNYDYDANEPTWKPMYDIRGLNMEDVESWKPDFILYRLGDGTLLKANLDAIAKAGKDENCASTKDLECLKHLIGDLEVVEMPEVEEIPTFDL
jgi:hypothetical protein